MKPVSIDQQDAEPCSVSLASPSDEGRWDEFVEAHPRASLCHLYAWRRVVEQSYRLKTRYLIAEGPAGRVRGVLPLTRVPGLARNGTLVSVPFLDQGGAIVDSVSAAAELRSAAMQAVRSLRARGLDLRGSSEADGPVLRDRFLAVLPLPETRERLWSTIGPKVRNLVRKAERSGVTCKRVDTEELPAFYRVFRHNMRDAGSPVHALAFFGKIFEHLGDRAALYVTRSSEGDVIAGAVAIRFRDVVSVPWASALPAARSLAPNYCLYWTLLTEALAAGARAFDFGRSSTGSGTLHFKRQWGAELQPLQWTYVDRRGVEHPPRLLDSRRNPWLARVWARLPLAVANGAGPLLRRRLAN